MRKNTTYRTLQTAWQSSCRLWRMVCAGLALLLLTPLASCEREPELHLFRGEDIDFDLVLVDLTLDVYWNYIIYDNVRYDWREEWYYGFDETGPLSLDNIGYPTPTLFNLTRYYTGDQTPGPHTDPQKQTRPDKQFRQTITKYGYFDFLAWNEPSEDKEGSTLLIDDYSNLDEVTATVTPTTYPSRYHAPRHTRAYNEPHDALFSAYKTGEMINREHDGFDFDAENNIWVKHLPMELQPLTYIYLVQVILRNNDKIKELADDQSILSGMANSMVLNTGVAGNDAISVYYKLQKDLKKNCTWKYGEKVDITAGRLLTFGICGLSANKVTNREDVKDPNTHWIDVQFRFTNDMDSTISFDVTDQVRNRWKGGVINLELKVDTVPMPRRSGGSAFDAVVKDYEEVEYDPFEM